MDKEITPDGTGQEPPILPQAGTGTGQTPPVPPPAPASESDAQTTAELAEGRREAARERTEKKRLADQLAELERAQLSEAERTKADLAAAQAALTAEREARRATELKVALLTAAPKVALLPAAYEDALKLINPALIEWDEAGTPTAESVDKALKALVKDRPYLLAPATPPPPAPGPAAFAPQGSAPAGTDDAGRTNMAPLYRIF
jgi:hypothetical protein